jgi:hypothetical protein
MNNSRDNFGQFWNLTLSGTSQSAFHALLPLCQVPLQLQFIFLCTLLMKKLRLRIFNLTKVTQLESKDTT